MLQEFFKNFLNRINQTESPVKEGTYGDAVIKAVARDKVGRFGSILLPDYTPPEKYTLNPSGDIDLMQITRGGIGCFGAYTGVKNPLEKALRYPGDTVARALNGDSIKSRIGYMGRLLSPGVLITKCCFFADKKEPLYT